MMSKKNQRFSQTVRFKEFEPESSQDVSSEIHVHDELYASLSNKMKDIKSQKSVEKLKNSISNK